MRVAFCGASGTGKTTLARLVAEIAGIPLNPVGSRSVAREMGFSSPYDVDAAGKRWDFQQKLQTDKIAWELAHESFVTDRTTLDELAYTTLHGGGVVDAEYLRRATEHVGRYTHIFCCPIGAFFDLAGDSQRCPSEAYHRVYDAMVCGFALVWGSPAGFSVLEQPTVLERIKFITSQLSL